jgi:hypothetical protein
VGVCVGRYISFCRGIEGVVGEVKPSESKSTTCHKNGTSGSMEAKTEAAPWWGRGTCSLGKPWTEVGSRKKKFQVDTRSLGSGC